MHRTATARRLDFGEHLVPERPFRRGLALAPKPPAAGGPQKYAELDLRRRRAQIRARRALGLE